MAAARQYSDAVLASMQSLYGKGFLSPGGAAEVFDIVEGLAIEGREVLDLGCGLGGASALLAGTLGAARVVGVDLEPESLRRAAELVAQAGLTQRVSFEPAAPGTLPVPDQAFDVVFTKDVVCHVPDKPALMAEIFRVLRPGGVLACGDWVEGEGGPEVPESQKRPEISEEQAGRPAFEDWSARLAASGLIFHFETLSAYTAALRAAGFMAPRVRDHSAWSEENGRRQLDQSERDADALRRSLGEEGYRNRVALTRARIDALAGGSLRHVHIQAVRP